MVKAAPVQGAALPPRQGFETKKASRRGYSVSERGQAGCGMGAFEKGRGKAGRLRDVMFNAREGTSEFNSDPGRTWDNSSWKDGQMKCYSIKKKRGSRVCDPAPWVETTGAVKCRILRKGYL
ncbi:MAG: hypothetical protein C4582_03190 [Desulfobacteraceae bacterium]|jgi:hypothetical protein|nr:MAG: hypothetical protein C4582_03190 [Desulfobacteraceae bacterium]